jgi:hypothetical protein
MNTRITIGLAALLALAGVTSIRAQVPPQLLHYQGRVADNNGNFNGQGHFKFALVNGNGTVSYWSNDGQSGVNLEPAAHVQLAVDHGLFSVLLGDAGTVIPYATFDNPDVRLRVWFRPANNNGPFNMFTPDRRIVSVGYAMRAANVVDGAITGAQIANGAVGTSDLADGAVTTLKLANSAVTTAKLADGSVTPEKIPADSITGQKIAQNSVMSEDIADTLRLRDLQVESTGGLDRVQLTEEANSGALYMTHGTIGRFLAASGTIDGGFLRLYDGFGGIGLQQTTVELGSSSVGGYLRALQANAMTGVQINGQNGAQPGGLIEVKDADGTATIKLIGAQPSTGGSRIEMTQGNGALTVLLDGEVGTGGGGYLQLRNGTGTGTITLDSDAGGEGRVTTQVLEITGGSDLSENFDIQSPDAQPGMIVSIDPAHPGELAVSQRAYDRTVAGVVSGAGGVKPGMLMRQAGTKADGKHPVALTGRVYCLVDAGRGAVMPGDLITTSDTPGHGMKVTDHARAQGAIIGKAMTPLAAGRGLVLVLVSLQ